MGVPVTRRGETLFPNQTSIEVKTDVGLSISSLTVGVKSRQRKINTSNSGTGDGGRVHFEKIKRHREWGRKPYY